VTRQETARRVKAAIDLGGVGSVPELAKRIDRFGEKRIYEITRCTKGKPAAKAWELRAIAEACQVPYGLFTLELEAALDERRDGWQHQIEEAVRTATKASTEVADRLDTIESRIDAEETERDELQQRIVALEAALGDAANADS
jgi:hypothetical protein